MSETLEARAEILKLSRLLGREAGQLTYLEGMPSAEIRLLREQVTDVLFTAHGPALSRLAAAQSAVAGLARRDARREGVRTGSLGAGRGAS